MKGLQVSIALLLLSSLGIAKAAEVNIEGAHICCGRCVMGAVDALKTVEGVTNAKASKDDGSISFTAADDKAAAAGIDALAKAGFRGAAKHGAKTLAFPAANVEAGTKADKAVITGVHLCCGACYTAAQKALQSVNGVTAVTPDKQTKTLEISGTQVDLNAALDALFKAGFQAEVKK